MDMDKTQLIATAAVAVVSVGVGAGAGYFLGAKLTAKKYEVFLDEEIASVKEVMQQRMTLTQPFDTPQAAAEALLPGEDDEEVPDAVAELLEGYGAEVDEIDSLRALSGDVTSKNVFVENSVGDRSDEKPYLISLAEYMEDEAVEGLEFEKITITYWEGDDTLMDEREQIIPDVEGVVGSVHLTMFGEEIVKYSGDENVVYVRNERLRTDFEIMYESGHYSVTVLGMDPDMLEEPVTKKPLKKMRPDE